MVNQALHVLLLQSKTNVNLVFEQLKNTESYIIAQQQFNSLGAFEYLQGSTHWDVVIADYSDTHCCYFQILQILRSVGLETPLILIVDQIAATDAIRALKAGVSDILLRSEIACLDERISFELQAVKSRSSILQQEIRERQSIEAILLKQTQAQFLSLAANIPGAIYQFLLLADGSYSFPFVSPSCYEIYELTPFEIQQNPKKLFDIVLRQERLGLTASIQTSASKLEPWEWEGRIVTASGKQKWIKGAARPMQQDNGAILWDGLVMDITESKHTQAALEFSEAQLRYKASELERTVHELQRTQMQLIQTEKMSSLGQLVAGIAHEINNPINFIGNNINFANEYTNSLLRILDLYQKHYPNPKPEIQELAEAIELDFLKEDFPKILSSMQLGTDRIHEIIHGLRCFSRIEDTTVQNVNIHQIIDSVLLILHHRLKANGRNPGIDVIKQYTHLPLIRCYPGQLNQVFMNLIANAIDALEDLLLVHQEKAPHQIDYKPMIHICTCLSQDNSNVIIKIADNGSGIPIEKQDQIFNAFFTTKPVGKGTGLGLSISKQIIVEKHNGKLKCTSQPGQGTEFLIEIPVHLSEFTIQ